MKILVICQYYYPDPFRINDICEELVQRGHEVQVVTGIPNYPMGEYYAGYEKCSGTDEVVAGVKVHHCYTVARKKDAFHRFLNYYSYVFSSTRYVAKLKGDFDVVLVNQLSPVLMAKAGIQYAKKHGKKVLLYCLDLWPESLTVGGIRPGSFIYNYFKKASSAIYHQVDRILVTSQAFANYFREEFQIENTQYLPQYAEELFTPQACQKTPDDFVDLMFAGNVGSAQGVDIIVKAARKTQENKKIRWHIVGDGSEYERFVQETINMKNIIFHGRKELKDMAKYYAMADAMLATLSFNKIINMTLPGKVQTYMAAGKPILGSADGEIARVVREAKCGFCSAAGDAEGLAQIAVQFAECQDKRLLGENSRKYYEENFTRERFFENLLSELRLVIGL